VARIDIINARVMANDGCILVMDDTDYEPLSTLWNEFVEKYELKPISFITKSTSYHTIHTYHQKKDFVFYSSFWKNTTDTFPPSLPSHTYDCFFFTDCDTTYDTMKNTGWKRIKINKEEFEEKSSFLLEPYDFQGRIQPRMPTENTVVDPKKVEPKKVRNDLVFYTCYFGNDHQPGAIIPPAPSSFYDCFYFTNNETLFRQLCEAGKLITPNELGQSKGCWKGIFLPDVILKEDENGNAMDSKEWKAAPHHFAVLNDYRFSCYFDSKITCHEDRVLELANQMLSTHKLFLVPQHPFLGRNGMNIWAEYGECLHQPRYRKEKEQYEAYILHQLSKGRKADMPVHYATQFILRQMVPETDVINETWYQHIQECGIECQISFFFIQQEFGHLLYTVPYADGYSYGV